MRNFITTNIWITWEYMDGSDFILFANRKLCNRNWICALPLLNHTTKITDNLSCIIEGRMGMNNKFMIFFLHFIKNPSIKLGQHNTKLAEYTKTSRKKNCYLASCRLVFSASLLWLTNIYFSLPNRFSQFVDCSVSHWWQICLYTLSNYILCLILKNAFRSLSGIRR